MVEPFIVQRLLRFGDCDPSGTAYFPAYLNLLNEVVEDFWESLGVPLPQLISQRRIGTPTVQIDCQFRRPSLFGERLSFSLNVVKLGRSSLHIAHEVNGVDGLKWTARQVLVATSLLEHRAIPWPDDVRRCLEERFPALNAVSPTNP